MTQMLVRLNIMKDGWCCAPESVSTQLEQHAAARLCRNNVVSQSSMSTTIDRDDVMDGCMSSMIVHVHSIRDLLM